MERCAAVRLAFGPNPSAVQADDSLHVGQADTMAGKLAFSMETLKNPKQFVGIAIIKTLTIILQRIDAFALGFPSTDDDDGFPAFRSELDRVFQEIGPNLP